MHENLLVAQQILVKNKICFVNFCVGDVMHGHTAIFLWVIKFVLLSVFGGNFYGIMTHILLILITHTNLQ